MNDPPALTHHCRLFVARTAKKLLEMFDKLFQFFQNLFDEKLFAESIRMYPNVSECAKTSPNNSESVEKLRENVEKLTKTFFTAQ